MADFTNEDLSGSTLRHVRLRGARFEDVDLSGATFRDVWMKDVEFRGVMFPEVRMRGVGFHNVDIYGEIDGLVINGVDVGTYVQEELDRRYPERPLMRPTDADGFRLAWDTVERLCGSPV